MRDTGHRTADRGESFSARKLSSWRQNIRKRLEDMGCNPDLGWQKF
jgi:Fe2+ transport system protein FeoA